MLKLIREALSVYILSTRYQTLEKVCYGATAFSVERAVKDKLSEEQRISVAVSYLQHFLPGVSHKEAVDHLDAMHARLVGVGANPAGKVA